MMWEFYLSRNGWLLLLVETFNIFFFFLVHELFSIDISY